jgi:hypothetical protein
MSFDFTQDGQDGMTLRLEACECGSCKNMFFVPKGQFQELPTFCCFCGMRFQVRTEDDLGPKLRSFFGGDE